jgi:hypothetical protein
MGIRQELSAQLGDIYLDNTIVMVLAYGSPGANDPTG